MDLATFKVMWELSTPGTETAQYFKRLVQTEYYSDLKLLAPLDRMPGYKVHDSETLPFGTVVGVTFDTVTIDTPPYLRYLADRFTGAGGVLIRASVQHIEQVIEGGAGAFTDVPSPTSPDAVVVCTGLGTRFLGGIEDKNMYPIRGQTVIVRAPWIDFGRTIGDPDNWTYVIPRMSGDVILGGSHGTNDWYPRPRPETTRSILERNFKMCPELAPPEVRAEREPTIEDILPLVIEEGCGFRPARKGGIRLDVEWRAAGHSESTLPIVFNYGHGGYGFQSSWGSADIAYKLLEEAFNANTLHIELMADTNPKKKIIVLGAGMDLETFHTMWEMSTPGSLAEKCFLRMKHEEYRPEEKPKPDVHSFMPDFKEEPREVWPDGAVHGISFTTVTIDTPVYLDYLMTCFLNNGGTMIRGSVQHVDQLVEGGVYAVNQEGSGPVPPDAILVCVGLGARTLGGVEDHDVYPLRGQTVLLRAPWIRFGKALSSTLKGSWTYVIPRGPSGDVGAFHGGCPERIAHVRRR
ncbi:hypothetical protein C0991_006972 [Blastosporella zonata]|nr:hypothetical protein C0991_006972 [Blastosporella zonata]